MELKILFEQREVDFLDSKVSAFKAYISRTSPELISSQFKKMNFNFANFLAQINHPKTLHDHKRQGKIEQKIHATESVAEREWLLEKLEELK